MPRHNPLGIFWPLAMFKILVSLSDKILRSVESRSRMVVAVDAILLPYRALLSINVLLTKSGCYPNHFTAPPSWAAKLFTKLFLIKLDTQSLSIFHLL